MSSLDIGWAPVFYEATRGLELFVTKPQSLYDTHMKHMDHRYRQCPATVSLARRTYVVTAPFDAHFVLDADARQIEFINPHVQPLDFFNFRDGQYVTDSEPLISLNFHQLFLAEQSVDMQITAPWFEKQHSDFRVIPGSYDCGRWWRPVDFALQLPHRRSTVKIQRGQALFYVTFGTDQTIRLRELRLTDQLQSFLGVCTQAKHYEPRCPLRTLYGLFDKYKHKPRLEFIDK